MNIRVCFLSAIIAVGSLSTVPCFAVEPQIQPEERFRELELKWMDALAEKDAAVLEKILAKEFTIIGVGSNLDDPVGTRQAWLDVGLKRPFPQHKVRVLKVHQLPEFAVVHAVLTADFPPMPWIPEGGTLNFLTTDTWVYRDGRWQVIARHSNLPAKSSAP